MSATSQGIKFTLGGFFKQLFSKAEKNQPAPAGGAPVATAPAVETAPAPAAPGKLTVPSVTLPLTAVIAAFPLELRSKIRQEAGELTFTAPLEKVLPQLATGMVKVTYGDIRRAAPQLFAPGVESDKTEVVLPLGEVLSRINPAMLVRRATQKQVVVSDEIASPFAGRGNGLSVSVGNNKPASAAPTTVGPAPAPSAPSARPAFVPAANSRTVSDGTTTFQRKPVLPTPSVAAAPAKEPIFARKPIAPMTPAASALPTDDAPIFQRKPTLPSAPVASVAPAPPVAAAVPPAAPMAFKMADSNDQPLFVRQPAADAATISPIVQQPPTPPTGGVPPRPKDYLAAPAVPRVVQPTAQPAKPANVVPPVADAPVLMAPLTALAEAWPDAVRQEIVQSNLVDARLAMPVELVEGALKRGRVVFPWKTVRSWVRPTPQANGSAHDAVELEMPLNVLAPLFVARQKSAGRSQRVTVDETIPNLFFGLPKPEPAHTPKPADTNYYTWGDTTDKARVDDTDFKRKTTPGGTDFVAKYATPNEIVSRAAALDGVAGVLIALPDGLMVASRIPAEYNGDTLAAFLPQIFSKVSQCTKELRMGDLNNLNFTVGNVPWKIFRVNAIFFAAFGRAGEQMPTAELVALAAELDRRR